MLGGKARRKKLLSPKGMDVRPMMEVVKGAAFDILQVKVESFIYWFFSLFFYNLFACQIIILIKIIKVYLETVQSCVWSIFNFLIPKDACVSV